MSYVENFEVVPIGGTSKSTIKCVGVGKGANLSIESRSINFGVATLREEVTRSFKLKNSSTLPAVYQVCLLYCSVLCCSVAFQKVREFKKVTPRYSGKTWTKGGLD